jgi:outer membrane protein OmpA-like peptidoglycan-associated protein/tetratricopeptide (TPR) repeat protein
MPKTLLTILLLGSSIAWCTAQDADDFMDLYRRGEAALQAQDYGAAARFFQKSAQKRPDFAAAYRLWGQAEELRGNYLSATTAYQEVLKIDTAYSRVLYYRIGDVYYKMGRPEIALYYFRKFADLQERDFREFGLRGEQERPDELILLNRLEGNIRACEIQIDSIKFINVVDIANLGKTINSKDDDYFPFLSNDRQEIFFTRKSDNNDEDLFHASRRGKDWGNTSRVRGFNTNEPEGMTSFIRSGRTVYFTACNRDSVSGTCDLWEGIVRDGKLDQLQSTGSWLNSGSWDSQAAISCDGRRIFFASNRPGGLGGSDIWVSERNDRGQWAPPRNLGAPINTPEDEEAPFISNDGQTLYFSSTGHLGLGEQDIFMSWWDKRSRRWTAPINLGPPVNGPHRELGIFLTADGRQGYFASNRPGGEGGMDIYTFELSEQLSGDPVTYVEGVLLDSILHEPLPGGQVRLGNQAVFTADERGRFFICAPAGTPIDLAIDYPDYLPYASQFSIPHWDNRNTYQVELLLRYEDSFIDQLTQQQADPDPEPEPEPEPDRRPRSTMTSAIFFSFDESKLEPSAKVALDQLIEAMQDKTVERVTILGYADNIGMDNYNHLLSEERAKNVAAYLIGRGIMVNKVDVQGLGPIDNASPKAQNRRVDVQIIFTK